MVSCVLHQWLCFQRDTQGPYRVISWFLVSVHFVGRFLCSMLEIVMRWHGDKKTYEKVSNATKRNETAEPECQAFLGWNGEERCEKERQRGGGTSFLSPPLPPPPTKITSLLTAKEALILSFKQPYLVKNCQGFETWELVSSRVSGRKLQRAQC